MSDISTVGTRYNGADLEFFDKSSGNTVLAFRNAVGSIPVYGPATDSITAHAGGGQTNATKLTSVLNRVTTVASAADSVELPASIAGLEITIINAAASNSMNVFPATGEAINALSANSAFAVAAGKTATFYCVTAGQWHSILSA